ncbi:MAG: rhomboid family intramembrane serine protease [Planctomycetota bacterium]|jgi:membrane associated rhomboid family serine protease
MFILLPIRTSIRPWRTPYANYGLIAANLFFFLLTYLPHETVVNGVRVIEPSLREWAEQFMLMPFRPYLWQFVSYAFLHNGIKHIVGNMFFLYLFGNNVNDKLGNVGYVCLYLAGAVFSGIGHVLMSSSPVLGASGAVAAVTGAYLVLFPQTLITVFYWLIFFIDTVDIPALWFIGIKLIFWDNIIERSIPSIAYGAHLSGYTFGIFSMLLLLSMGLLSSTHFDLFSMLKRWNRRRVYRDVVSGGYDPFSGKVRSKRIRSKEVKSASQRKREAKISDLRNEISSRIGERNLPEAARLYLELIEADSSQVPPRQYLLDIANQLASENKHSAAASAYEKFLARYTNYEYSEQVQLMLGIIYSRYLEEPKLAVKNLEAACGKLTEPGQVKMCREELAKVREREK